MSGVRKTRTIYRHARAHLIGDGFPVRTLFSHDRTGRDVWPVLGQGIHPAMNCFTDQQLHALRIFRAESLHSPPAVLRAIPPQG